MDTFEQIAETKLTNRPLLLCDVDEVVLEFMAPLERHMNRKGYEFRYDSYALNGNIRHQHTGAVPPSDQVRSLIHSFFAEDGASQPAVIDAADQLEALSEHVDIIMLTNMPGVFRDQRINCLTSQGMPYPVVTNNGSKGPAVSAFRARTNRPIAFIDDSPTNLISVGQSGTDTALAHFIAHPRLFDLVPDVPDVMIKTSRWQILGDHLQTWLETCE
ncbi:hypothetical protein [Coralliovum pocilloporae]|uniref:hypothetical protein n=1 Tax=Coralliovum pocilloporae TaxID=3066369 RepID=UPI003307BC65